LKKKSKTKKTKKRKKDVGLSLLPISPCHSVLSLSLSCLQLPPGGGGDALLVDPDAAAAADAALSLASRESKTSAR
jgi:hypothetical protein